MTTAYNAYRAKQDKGKNSRQKKDPNDPQALLDTVSKTATKLQSLDTAAWTVEDKTGFRTALTGLKTEIDNYLEANPVTAKKTTKKSS